MRNPLARFVAGGPGRLDGVGAFARPSRHRPSARGVDATSLRGSRRRAHLPGPPGDIHTARTATDTWPGRRPALIEDRPSRPPTYGNGERVIPAGGGESSG